jgi:uncharacterized protein (DUF952 family)
MIYHIAKVGEFSLSTSRGSYYPGQFPQDGFIHCSTKNQVLSVANTWFLHAENLVLLEIDEQMLNIEVKYENLEGGQEMYPHIYGEIALSAIPRYSFFTPQSSGFSFPTKWIEVEP